MAPLTAAGPVASLETIKHLGTNGGGFFNANAAHPFDILDAVNNLIQRSPMIILPSSIVLCFGEMIGSRRQAWVLYGVMTVMVIMFLPIVVVSEQAGTPAEKADRDAGLGHPTRWQHGREGGSLWHCAKRDLRLRHHAVHHRKRELDA